MAVLLVLVYWTVVVLPDVAAAAVLMHFPHATSYRDATCNYGTVRHSAGGMQKPMCHHMQAPSCYVAGTGIASDYSIVIYH